MNPKIYRVLAAMTALVILLPLLRSDEISAQSADTPAESDFRTLDKAITTKGIGKGSIKSEEKPSKNTYLGVHLQTNKAGDLIVSQIDPNSPASKAGLQSGDLIVKVHDQERMEKNKFAEWVRKQKAGSEVKFGIERDKKPMELSVNLAPASDPFTPRAFGRRGRRGSTPSNNVSQRPRLGIQIGKTPETGGVLISGLTTGYSAEKAGIKVGDVLKKINGKELKSAFDFRDILSGKKAGDILQVVLLRNDKDVDLKVRLVAAKPAGKQTTKSPRGFGRSRGRRGRRYWTKPVYRLAVVRVEFPDVKSNDKITAKSWEEALFSKGSYNKKSVTGDRVFGSLNDFYQEQSYNKFRVEGKVFDFVQVSKKREAYVEGAAKRAFFTEALDKLTEREGKNALDKFDGLFFMYAGGRAKVKKGGLYWPHKSFTAHRGKRWSYFICPEGGKRMSNISVIAHEFGHLLGMPDLYPRQGVDPEGLGGWCTMSTGHGRSGKPLHFSAWCKENLGWLQPVVIDPSTPQKLILRPVQSSPKECCKILLKRDGSEYFLLVNRTAKGFDSGIPGQGLLIWHVVNNRPHLLESHGIFGPSGPRQFLSSVPYPSKANNAFTPYTLPSSRPASGSGVPVFITNIERRGDGSISFFVGYEFF